MNRRHVIKKIVFEVEGTSHDAVAEIEGWLREIIHDIIIPKLGEYCDSLTSEDAVLYIDKILLDLGPVQPGEPLEEIRSKVDSSFEKNSGMRMDRYSGASVAIADLQIILYFLRTGMLPWRASVHTRLPAMFENLLNTDPKAVEAILRVVLEDQVAFQRLVWHTSDDLLFALFVRLPEQGPGWTMIEELKRMWDKSTTWGTLRNRRFHFWRIVVRLLRQKRKRDFVKEFLAQWASAQNMNIFSLLHLLERYSRKHQQEQGQKLLFTSLIPDSTRPGERMEILHSAVHTELARIGRELTMMTGRTTVLLWQVRFLGIIARYLSSIPAHYQADLADAMKQFLSSISVKDTDDITEQWKPGGRTYQLDLKTIEPLLQDNLGPAYQTVKDTLGEFLSKQGRFGSADQFLFFLNKLEQVVQAFPSSSMKEALKEYVQRLKRKISIQVQAMRRTLSNQVTVLLRKLEYDLRSLPARPAQHGVDLIETCLIRLMKSVPLSILPQEKRAPYKELLLLIERSLSIPSPESWEAACSGVKRMEESQEPEQTNNPRDGKSTDPAEEDIYIRNAGLALMAPFIPTMFEKLGYAGKGGFTDTGAVEAALLLLQYCVSPDTGELQEYDLPLNKVLCGMDVTAPVNLSRALSEEEKAAVEHTIQALLQEAAVFRNISPEGFRNAFLQREGVLRLYDQHAVLKVSRETFDIVLDKVPWQYHVVRFPWMKYPLMIEW